MALYLETDRGNGKPPKRRLWYGGWVRWNSGEEESIPEGGSFPDTERGRLYHVGLNTVQTVDKDRAGDGAILGATYSKEAINEAKFHRTVRRWVIIDGKPRRVSVEQRLVYKPLFGRRG